MLLADLVLGRIVTMIACRHIGRCRNVDLATVRIQSLLCLKSWRLTGEAPIPFMTAPF
jgi:hypothetical protein